MGGPNFTENVTVMNGSLGVRTTSPGNPLHVVGIGRFAEDGQPNSLVHIFSTGDYGYLDSYGNAANSGGLIFRVNDAGTEAMRILPNGYVGIGTTNPGNPLHVVGIGRFAQSGQPNSLVQIFSTGDYGYLDSYGDAASSGGLIFRVNDAGTEAMRILASGNIGINTTSPGEKLELKGNFKIDGGSLKFVNWGDGDQVLIDGVTWNSITFDNDIQAALYMKSFTIKANTASPSYVLGAGLRSIDVQVPDSPSVFRSNVHGYWTGGNIFRVQDPYEFGLFIGDCEAKDTGHLWGFHAKLINSSATASGMLLGGMFEIAPRSAFGSGQSGTGVAVDNSGKPSANAAFVVNNSAATLREKQSEWGTLTPDESGWGYGLEMGMADFPTSDSVGGEIRFSSGSRIRTLKTSTLMVTDLSDRLRVSRATVSNSDTGTVTSYTSTSISDSNKSWTDDQWKGRWVVCSGQIKRVYKNTSNTLHVRGTWNSPSGAYQILAADRVYGTKYVELFFHETEDKGYLLAYDYASGGSYKDLLLNATVGVLYDGRISRWEPGSPGQWWYLKRRTSDNVAVWDSNPSGFTI